MIRLYVMGSDGQVARSLREAARKHRDIVIGHGSRPGVDILLPDSVEQALADFSPDIVVNPAAYTAVDRAETESDLAFSVNRDRAATVALASQRRGIPVIHLPTDYVFDGKKTALMWRPIL